MTFRQILAALWRRKWIIVAVTVLAVLIGAGYLARLEPGYVSSTDVRFSSSISDASASGQLAGVPVDAGPSLITSETVLGPAADSLGIEPDALFGAISYELVDTDGGPLIVEISTTAPTPRAAIARLNAVVASLSTQLDSVMQSTLATLQTQLQQATAQAMSLQVQAGSHPNDAIIATNLSQALARMSTLNTDIMGLQAAGPSITTVSPPWDPESVNPSPSTVLAIALLCGLLAGAGIALIRDRFDDRLRAEDDLEQLSGEPTIALLANDSGVARGRERLPAASADRTALSESLRSLRTSLQVLLPEGKGVLVVTSVEPGDGKTFVAANLALSWARAGRKVILVAGDMRRPRLDLYFGAAARGVGLAELLLDGVDGTRSPGQPQLTEMLRPTSFRGLRVLPAGEDAADPADLLAGASLGRAVRYLARNADIVIIDSPPALALADASELAAYADGVVVLTTVNRTKRTHIVETVNSLKANGANILGLIVNRSRVRLPKSYGSYYVNSSRPTTPRRPPAADRRAAAQEDVDRALDLFSDEPELELAHDADGSGQEPVSDTSASVAPSSLRRTTRPRQALLGSPREGVDAEDDDLVFDDDLALDDDLEVPRSDSA